MTIRLLRFAPVLALSISLSAWGQGLPDARPAEVGLDADQLSKITAMLQADVESGATVGSMALVARNGKVAYSAVAGAADRENQQPMKEDSIFRIYSMSKPIVSTALMTLYEDGLFHLQDPVGKYLPEFRGLQVLVEKGEVEGGAPGVNRDRNAAAPPLPDPSTYDLVPARRPVTVQDLMRHTAGLTYGIFGNTTVDKTYRHYGLLGDHDLKEFIAELGKAPLQYQPGTRWHYSVSVDVQGALIEVLSGMPLDEFLEERIFKPLEMVDTGFYVPAGKMDRFAQMYVPGGENGLEVAPTAASRNFVKKPTFFSGGGGLVSTTADYLRFCQMHLNGGHLDGVRILGRKTIELMRTDHLGDVKRGNGAYGFGLGFAVAKDPALAGAVGSVGEYNWGGAAGTSFWIDPEENLIGIYMIQILGGSGSSSSRTFKNFAYQSIID